MDGGIEDNAFKHLPKCLRLLQNLFFLFKHLNANSRFRQKIGRVKSHRPSSNNYDSVRAGSVILRI